MNPDLSILFRFLDGLDNQVIGRHGDRPPPEIETALQRLLSGETLAEADREAVFQALKKNTNWIKWLAEQVKDQRTNPPRKKS